MLSSTLTQKFTHLFKILDFDHDGLLMQSDFQNLGDNVAIFRCLMPPSEVEDFITKRGQDFWHRLTEFLANQEPSRCNLTNWLKFLEAVAVNEIYGPFEEVAKQMAEDIFYIYDKDHNNFLSKQEYMCFFVSLRVEIKFIDICFKKLDINGDMQLSKEELASALVDFFTSEDTKKPGNLLFGNPESYQFDTRRTVYTEV
ncbi:EF-hand domain-containing protein [Reichenbachiella sp.]|uniref:EF-hand domain-containing protein n=1 Tax=Reichenbachiella sp. TaxID=2184521 RepID=UPI003BAE2EB8